MYEVQAAALHLDPDALSRSVDVVGRVAAEELHRQQILRLRTFLHDGIAPSDLHILIALRGLVHLVILTERTVGIQEAVVGSDNDICAAPLVGDDADHVLQLFNRRITGAEDRTLQMTGLVDGVVVDINHVHTLDECLPVGTLHADNVLVLERHAGRVRCLQELVPVGSLSGLSVGQHRQSLGLAALQLDGQLLMRK